MDNKTFILALKKIIREELKTVIKQELTEILKEGLKPTILEMTQPNNVIEKQRLTTTKKPIFEDNKWASVLNDTDMLVEQQPFAMISFSDMMNESYDDTIAMTSRDAAGFGVMRQNNPSHTSSVPKIMEDPETGNVMNVAPEVAAAMTRDYSAMMKAIDKKKGMA